MFEFKSTSYSCSSLLIKLTDISLTPLESLNRIIYDFSSAVNEVADNTMENYKKYELYHL